MFVSVILFAPALSQLPVGTLADFYGRARISVLVALLGAICAFMLALQLPTSFLAVTIVAAIVTGLSHPLYALGYGRLVDGGHDLIAATTAGLIGYNIGTRGSSDPSLRHSRWIIEIQLASIFGSVFVL